MLIPCPHSQRLLWHHVPVVYDYADIVSTWSRTTSISCLHSQQLRRHCVCYCIVNNHANTVSLCQRSQWLRGHRVSVVNNYADTMQIILPWNKYKTNEKISKKCYLRFSKIVCQRSHWLRGHGVRRWLSDFRTLRSNIFAKTKKLAKPFLRVIMGPISWHCPFSQSSLFGWKSKKRWVYTVYVIQ